MRGKPDRTKNVGPMDSLHRRSPDRPLPRLVDAPIVRPVKRIRLSHAPCLSSCISVLERPAAAAWRQWQTTKMLTLRFVPARILEAAHQSYALRRNHHTLQALTTFMDLTETRANREWSALGLARF